MRVVRAGEIHYGHQFDCFEITQIEREVIEFWPNSWKIQKSCVGIRAGRRCAQENGMKNES